MIPFALASLSTDGPRFDATLMSEPLEPSWSESIGSLEGSPARISAKPENESESREIAQAFGLSSPALLGYWDLEACLLRTSQVCWISGQCRELSENWPDSGMWDAGSAYELRTSEPVTLESESLLWPTIRSSSGGGNTSDYQGEPYRPAIAQLAQRWPTARQEDGESCGNHPNSEGDSLTGMTRLWRTPAAPGSGGPRNRKESTEQGHQFTIAEQAEHWHTPHGISNRDHTGKIGGCGGGEFAKQANQWQTPAADSFRSRGGDRVDEMGLDQQARMFPTPASRDYRTPNKESYQKRSQTTKGEQLQNFVAHSLPDPIPPSGPQSSETTPGLPRRLNPRFVEWLMGFPIGWTEL